MKRDPKAERASAETPPVPLAARDNRLLQVLPDHEYHRVNAELEPVTLGAMQVLAEAGHPLEHVYFPRTALISMLRRMRDGTTVEAGVIGREGMAGIAVALGNTWSPETVVASVPGIAHRIAAGRFRELLPELPVMHALLQRYVLTVLDQLGQTIACNARHSVEQRCSRWLLNAHDSAGDEFYLTHDVLARMLGVRRAGVTVAALVLQHAKLIDYSRGKVVVLDRPGLEAAACECYCLIHTRSEQLFGSDSPRR
jgi:CRP-like cAMP-binding protein